MKLAKTLTLLITLSASGWAHAFGEDDILGTWSTENSRSKVEVVRCSAGLCGTIVELLEPVYPEDDEMAGQAKVDRENPDEALRSRPLIGLQILSGFRFDDDDQWEDGQIYDPKSGSTYSCKMTMVDKNTLKVRGYIGFSLLGRTTVWTR